MDDSQPPTSEATAPPARFGLLVRRGEWIALVVLLLAVGAVRWRLLDMPFERDEGEYALMGQLLLDGVPPYAEAYNMKLPGVYAAYAALMAVFGETIRGVHLGLLFTNALTTVLVFLLGRRLFGPLAGIASAAVFAVLTLNPTSHGFFANAEHYVLPFAVGGVMLLHRAIERDRGAALVGSGLLLGVAFLMKQHAAAFALAAGVTLLIAELRRRPRAWGRSVGRVGLLVAAGIAPWCLTCLILWLAGVFDTFWFWTVTYARSYTGQIEGSMVWELFRHQSGKALGGTPWLWILVALATTAVAWSGRVRRHWALLVPFALLSCVAICPGFFFREHYFLLLAPAAALLVGGLAAAVRGLATARTGAGRIALSAGGLLVLGAALAEPAVRHRDYYFRVTPDQAVRSTFLYNPFPEAVRVGRMIERYSDEDDRIAVLGSEPQLCFYADRRPATGFIYTYPLMKDQPFAERMHRQMIREIEEDDPEILVQVNVHWSWMARPDSVKLVLVWFEQYSKAYECVGFAEIEEGGSRYYQDLEAMRRYRVAPPNAFWIAVLRRR